MPSDREAWLNATVEEVLDSDLPICDPHHHLWDYPHNRYLLDDLLRDTGSGHNVQQTVFVECVSMYRTDGPDEMKPVGETEFVQGVANRSAAGGAGKTAVCAGIVGFADLTLGDVCRLSWKRIWRPAPTASVASGTRRVGTPAPTFATRIRARPRA